MEFFLTLNFNTYENKRRGMLVALMVCSIWMVGCDDDDNTTLAPIGAEKTYELAAIGGTNVSGIITFKKVSSVNTLVTIELTGTQVGDSHPAHIHSNTADAGGGIVIDLSNVNGETGVSETSITQLNSGTAITFDELIRFSGHVNVHQSAAAVNIVIEQGNIGSNVTSGGMTY